MTAATAGRPVTIRPSSRDEYRFRGLVADPVFVGQLRRDYRRLRRSGVSAFDAKHVLYRTLIVGMFTVHEGEP